MDKSLKWFETNKDIILENIKEFLKIPSVSSDPEAKEDVNRAAMWVRNNFERIGLETKVLETPGYPIIFAQTKVDKSRPTVLCYFHYDVQPAGDESLWKYSPFEPTLEGDKLFARGSTDDKLQGLIHVAALEAMLHSDELPVNFKFCIEGEEEISSPHVMDVVKANTELFECDYIVISDGPMLSEKLPSIEIGARGILYTQIRLIVGGKDMHSGQFGGYVKNANFELARIVSKLKDENGKITIPGFYDGIVPPTKEELEGWGEIEISDDEYLNASGTFTLDEGEKGYSLLERNWSRPTLEVNGIWGGFIGDGAKTVIPFEARAKISMRLVPGQNPEELLKKFEDYLKSFENEGVKIELEWHHEAPSYFSDADNEIYKKVQDSYEEVYGTKAVLTRTGGTIGLLAGMKEVFDKPILLLNFGLPDENMHAPNEFMRISNFVKGVEVSLRLWDKLR